MKFGRNKKKIAIYPGTFDPVTFGHVDVLERASALFDEVIISVAVSSAKKALFTESERIDMLKQIANKYPNVAVDSFKGLLVEYAESKKAGVIVRGLRAISDFEYEFQMALTNRKLAENITTVFLMPNEKYSYLNSTLVREIALYGGNLSNFVPSFVEKKLREKFKVK
ncbi:MAG: pantetheine-phosphate adenylyltransferase [Ignavibacteria bacterium]